MRKIINKWIAHSTNRENADVNLLCFTYAGGSPSFFAPWKKLFGENINLCPVLYPGRELRKNDPMPDSVEELAYEFVSENGELFSKPYAVFGHCTGALIGYEAVLAARKLFGCEPLIFFASGCESPRYAMSEMVAGFRGKEPTNEEMLESLLEYELVDQNFAANQTFLDYYLPIYRVDLRILAAYKKESDELMDCPIFTLHGNKDRMVNSQKIASWKYYTRGELTDKVYEGKHFYVNDYKKEVCSIVSEKIESEMCRREPEYVEI